MARQRQRHQGCGKHRIGGAHHGEKVAVADAVPGHAKHRRDQGPGVVEGSEQGQQQDRSGLDQHVPAKDQRLHLESPRGEQVGRPLKTITPDTERSERGESREFAQVATPRFIAFHPCPVSPFFWVQF